MKTKTLAITGRLTALSLTLFACEGVPEDGDAALKSTVPPNPLAEALDSETAQTAPRNEPAGITSVQQALVSSRSDFVASVEVAPGHWGTWRQANFCNEGTFAVGMKLVKEKYQGGQDDTALNRVTLKCSDEWGNGPNEVSDGAGIWGEEFDWGGCGRNDAFMFSMKMKVEAPQGSGDDTAANDVLSACDDGTSVGGVLAHAGWASFGLWSGWAQCPGDSVICGIKSRFESSQGSGDDSALNGLKIQCCTRPDPVWEIPRRVPPTVTPQ